MPIATAAANPTFTFGHPLNPILIHWQINPGLAVNELLLGQRIPRQTFVCRHCGDWSKPEFQFYECPGCQRKHSSKIWIGRNAFGNWHGLVCPDCEAKIPCLMNVFSLLIWVVLSPILLPLYFKTNTNFRSWSARRSREARQRLFPQRTETNDET